jgi:SulP family sulfate permease
LPAALTIGALSFLESIAIAQKFAEKHGDQICASQEMVALGASNVFASAFGGFPVAGVCQSFEPRLC